MNKPLTDAQEEVYRLHKHEGMSLRQIAAHLNKGNTTVRMLYRRAVENGAGLSEGALRAMTHAGLNPGDARGGWIHNYDPETGKKLFTTHWVAPYDNSAPEPEDFVRAICERLTDVPPAPFIARPQQVAADQLNAVLGADLHMGVTIDDYGPDRALAIAKAAHMECLESLPPAERTLIVWNGDTTHANDDQDVTYRNRHRLKVEGPHHENIGRVLELVDFQIQSALAQSDHVDFQIRPGNHDPSTPSYVVHALNARYGDEPRVSVYQSVRWWGCFQWQKIMLALHHGDGNAPKELAAAAPYIFKDEFASAGRHFLITAHKHQDKAETFGAMRWRQLPAMTKLDQHAEQLGFADTSSLRAMRVNVLSGAFSEYTAGLAA